MDNKTDFRDLIVDCPACKAKVQAEHLDGATYTAFEPWLRSMRKGRVGRIYRPFLLGGGKGAFQSPQAGDKFLIFEADRIIVAHGEGAVFGGLQDNQSCHSMQLVILGQQTIEGRLIL